MSILYEFIVYNVCCAGDQGDAGSTGVKGEKGDSGAPVRPALNNAFTLIYSADKLFTVCTAVKRTLFNLNKNAYCMLYLFVRYFSLCYSMLSMILFCL